MARYLYQLDYRENLRFTVLEIGLGQQFWELKSHHTAKIVDLT